MADVDRASGSSDVLIVLLPGAGMGPWIWDRVREALPHTSVALDVPSRSRDATPESCAEELSSRILERTEGDIVVVLHSVAGVLASPLARKLGGRLRCVVFVAAVVPPPGRRYLDALPFVNRILLRLLFMVKRNGLKPAAGMIRQELCNDLSKPDADRVVSEYRAEWPGLYLTPVEAGDIPPGSMYVKLLRDRAVPPALQGDSSARLAAPRVREIDSGHLAMLSSPDALASVIDEASAR